MRAHRRSGKSLNAISFVLTSVVPTTTVAGPVHARTRDGLFCIGHDVRIVIFGFIEGRARMAKLVGHLLCCPHHHYRLRPTHCTDRIGYANLRRLIEYHDVENICLSRKNRATESGLINGRA